MKTKILTILFLLTAEVLRATIIIPISLERTIGISGKIVDSSYSQLVSYSQLFNTFDQSISNELTIESVIIPSYGPTKIHVDSLASQTSNLTENGDILLGARLNTNVGVFLDPVYPPYNRWAQANFSCEYTFNVVEPIDYTLSASINRSSSHPYNLFGPPKVDIFLSSIGPLNLPLNGTIYDSGTLLPNIYTLQVSSNTFAFQDPLGDFEKVGVNLDFQTTPITTTIDSRVTSVPEMGSSLLLLTISFVVFLFLRHVNYLRGKNLMLFS